jgi:hypothetical protein
MSVGGRRDSDRMVVGFITTYTSTKPSYECLVVVRHEFLLSIIFALRIPDEIIPESVVYN